MSAPLQQLLQEATREDVHLDSSPKDSPIVSQQDPGSTQDVSICTKAAFFGTLRPTTFSLKRTSQVKNTEPQPQTELEKKLTRRKKLNNEIIDNKVTQDELRAQGNSVTATVLQAIPPTVCASAPYSQLASAVPPTAPTPSFPNASRMRSASVMIRKKQEGTISTNTRHRWSLRELGDPKLGTNTQTELEKKLARRKILNNEAPDNEVMHHELIPQAEDTSSTFSSSQSNTMTVCASAPYSQLASAVPPTAPTPSSPNASRMRSASVMIRKKQEGTISTNIRHRLSLGELEDPELGIGAVFGGTLGHKKSTWTRSKPANDTELIIPEEVQQGQKTELEKILIRRKRLNNEVPNHEVMQDELISTQAEDTSSTISSSNAMTVCASAPYSQLASAVPPTAPTPSSPNASRMRSASVMIHKKQEGTISTKTQHRLSLVDQYSTQKMEGNVQNDTPQSFNNQLQSIQLQNDQAHRVNVAPSCEKNCSQDCQREEKDSRDSVPRAKLEVAYEYISQLNHVIIQKTLGIEELEGLNTLLKHQADQYRCDFNEERAAREKAMGERDNEHMARIYCEKDMAHMGRNIRQLEATLEKALSERDELKVNQMEKTELLQEKERSSLRIHDLEDIQKRFLKERTDEYRAHQREKAELLQEREHFVRRIKELEAIQERSQREKERFLHERENFVRRIQELEASAKSQDELEPYLLPALPPLGECQGSGSYGSVYRIMLNEISCIAKRVHDILLGQGREDGVNPEDQQAAYRKFRQECILLSRMRHPNIVQFMGVHYGPVRDYGRELTLVMECLYMNLEECLKKHKNIEMWLKMSILLDVSRGLVYLHSQNIIHRDLTAANVLLTNSFHAKIADLGVSKIINVHPLAATKQSMIPGTLGYMPPEALAETPRCNCALDVFSFGVLMLYVLLQEYPQYYDEYVTPQGILNKVVHIQKRLKWINKLPSDDPCLDLIRNCLLDEAVHRPSSTNLNGTLVRIAEKYPKPYQDIIVIQQHVRTS